MAEVEQTAQRERVDTPGGMSTRMWGARGASSEPKGGRQGVVRVGLHVHLDGERVGGLPRG